MIPILIVALVLTCGALFYDRLVKKRKLTGREEMEEDIFLQYFEYKVDETHFARVITTRNLIAKELGLPANRIRPTDVLVELRDEFCPVVSGHMALGELLEDLDSEIEPRVLVEGVETVGQYIEQYISGSEEPDSFFRESSPNLT